MTAPVMLAGEEAGGPSGIVRWPEVGKLGKQIDDVERHRVLRFRADARPAHNALLVEEIHAFAKGTPRIISRRDRRLRGR